MRKLPLAAAEDLLEFIMPRYERFNAGTASPSGAVRRVGDYTPGVISSVQANEIIRSGGLHAQVAHCVVGSRRTERVRLRHRPPGRAGFRREPGSAAPREFLLSARSGGVPGGGRCARGGPAEPDGR